MRLNSLNGMQSYTLRYGEDGDVFYQSGQNGVDYSGWLPDETAADCMRCECMAGWRGNYCDDNSRVVMLPQGGRGDVLFKSALEPGVIVEVLADSPAAGDNELSKVGVALRLQANGEHEITLLMPPTSSPSPHSFICDSSPFSGDPSAQVQLWLRVDVGTASLVVGTGETPGRGQLLASCVHTGHGNFGAEKMTGLHFVSVRPTSPTVALPAAVVAQSSSRAAWPTGSQEEGFSSDINLTPPGVGGAFADMNGDGRLDLVLGGPEGKLQYWQNIGRNRTQALQVNRMDVLQVSDSGPFSNIQLTGDVTPAIGDIDLDGDLDLIVIQQESGSGQLLYYENRGNATNALLQFVPSANETIFAGVDVTPGSSFWRVSATLADMNADGLLDLVICAPSVSNNDAGRDDPRWYSLNFYINTGTRDESGKFLPQFERVVDEENPFYDLPQLRQRTVPEHFSQSYSVDLSDWDGDGDLDLTLGGMYDRHAPEPLTMVENVGSAAWPRFDRLMRPEHAFVQDIGSFFQTDNFLWGDVDNDGILDLARTGGFLGLLQVYPGGVADEGPVLLPDESDDAFFETPIIPSYRFSNNYGMRVDVALGDLNGDGRPDIVTTRSPGGEQVQLEWWKDANPGVRRSYELVGDLTNVSGARPLLADLNGDGLVDLLTSVGYYANVGSALQAEFELRTGPADPLPSAAYPRNGGEGGRSVADLNHDTYLDLVVCRGPNFSPELYVNMGNATHPVFTETPTRVLTSLGRCTEVAFADMDHDGDLDAILLKDGFVSHTLPAA